jgi:hypothetical protein
MLYLFISIVIILLLAASGLFFLLTAKPWEKGTVNSGRWMGIGMAIGISLGLPVGLAMKNIAIGPAIGVAFGTAIGLVLEAKYSQGVKPMDEAEKKIMKISVLLGFVLVMLGLAVFTLTLFNKALL